MLKVFHPVYNFQAFVELTRLLTRHRLLTLELARREVNDRHAGQWLGSFWTIGHPLAMMLVYVFVFGFVFKARMGGTADLPLDYTAYMLAGLIPWLAFQESMGKASTVITSNANLVKQVIFPIEVLPIKGVLATLLTQGIFLTLLFLYTVITARTVPWTYVLLPVLLVLQVLSMIGISYSLASVGTFFRDVKELVQLFCSVSFFLLPILYVPESVPVAIRPLFYLNPFSYLVWCYQDALYFGRFEHPWAWVVFAVTSLLFFIIGYRIFRSLKPAFGNVL